MVKPKAYLAHLKSGDDLVTTYESVRAGFVALALEKNRRATPFVEQARALKVAAADAATPADLINIEGIQSALLTAAGVSDKAAQHLQPEDKESAVQSLIEKFLAPAGVEFIEELIYRFLLTRGDTLGGSMRNVGGMLAQRKLSRALISTLAVAGTPYQWLHAANNTWLPMSKDDSDIELRLRGLSWVNGRKRRTVVYNLTVPFLKNNVDLQRFAIGCDRLEAGNARRFNLRRRALPASKRSLMWSHPIANCHMSVQLRPSGTKRKIRLAHFVHRAGRTERRH